MNWRRKKFTFMVIPDANSSVVRFQLSAIVMLAASILVALILAGAIVAFLLYRGNVSAVEELEGKLSAATGEYEEIIQGKDKHIDELQTEVAGLSDQARSINDHIVGIKELESQLKEMVGIKDGDKAEPKTETDDNSEQMSMDSGGTGGEELPVTREEMEELVNDTRDEFLSLDERILALKPELERTKNDVIKLQKKLAITPTIWPTDSRRVTSLFGVRKDPFTRRATYHAGLDIGGNTGDPIYAAADGVVEIAERDSTHGNYVSINHSGGVRTSYLHMSKILTEVGAKVHKGDVIGRLGSTGRSTGPHLHYEVSLNGNNVDPRPYLKATRRENG